MSRKLEKTQRDFDREIKRKKRHLFLRRAANFPRIIKFWEKSNAKFAAAGGVIQPKPAKDENIFQDESTAHYFHHHFDPWEHPHDGDDYLVELARFRVPLRASGVVRRLMQWVSGYRELVSWGDPLTGNAVIDSIQWYLRLTPYTGQQDARYIDPTTFLPGSPYPDLHEFHYLWFLPDSFSSDLNLVVPTGHVLRLFARCPDPGELETYSVMGRFAGYIQSTEKSTASSYNVKKGF